MKPLTLSSSIVTSLAEAYGNNYPLSDAVQQGLERVLNESYKGREKDFNVKFITPTIELLKELKDKGFPLIKNGNVIVHLVAPTSNLENGEMFFQVGHRTPGTLAVKFTKYQGDEVILQPGNVSQQDFRRAFTQQYIEEMRNASQKLGDQLMRVLLTSKENGRRDFAVEKVEVRKIMPYSLGQLAASSCHPPVKETSLPKSLGPLNQEDVLLSCCCSDVQGASLIVTGGRSQEYFWKADANPSNSPVAQVANGGHVPTVMASGSQLAEQTSGGKASNLKCPPSRQADTGSAEEPDTGPPTKEPSSGAEVNNPQYPPWEEAVKDGAPDIFPCSQQNEPLFKGSASKAKYPPLLHAVRDSAEELDTGETTEPSYGAWVNNPKYPPLEVAVKDDSTEVFPYRQQNGPSFERNASEGSYPPPLQAAGGSAEELDTGQPTGEPSSGAIQSRASCSSDTNQPYPPLSLAARDDGTTPPSSAAARNEPYPPLAQAVRDQPVAQGRCQPAQPTILPASRVSYKIDEDLELF